MGRIFRVALLFSLIKDRKKITIKNNIYIKAKKLISQTAIILPIVIRFFPLYMISYYILGVIGMQIFDRDNTDPSASIYSGYDDYSNFRSFYGSQFIFVMVLVEAGWSQVAYSHAQQYGYYAITMLFFVLCHIIIVIILSSLLKGLIWGIYETVHEELDERKRKLVKINLEE